MGRRHANLFMIILDCFLILSYHVMNAIFYVLWQLHGKEAREPFYKMHERPGYPTGGMLALNKILEVFS
jgi:hypothetical protein